MANPQLPEEDRADLQTWSKALSSGRNPFDERALKLMRSDFRK